MSPTEIRDWTIYKITNPTGRIYVGISSNYNRRIKCYKSGWCENQSVLYKSIMKYGFSNHHIEQIDTFTSDQDYAFGKEMFWIRSYMSHAGKWPKNRGMNMTDGGEGQLGNRMTEENKEKQRRRLLGTKASEETKRKMSETRKGKKINRTYTDAQKEALVERGRKLKHTDEAKMRIGEAAKGNKYGVGHKWSEQKRASMVNLMKGNKFGAGPTENNKKAIREAIRKRMKPIYQYDLFDNLVMKHENIHEAVAYSGIPRCTIAAVLCGQYEKMRGFKFKYQ